MTESKPKPCLHAFLIRQIDRDNPTGGFTGDWECVRCRQRFKTLVARDVPVDPGRTVFVNMTAWPYCFKGAEGIDDDN